MMYIASALPLLLHIGICQAYLSLNESVEIEHVGNRLRIRWNDVPLEELELFGYRVYCSHSVAFTDSTLCVDRLIVGTQIDLSPTVLSSDEPLYARIQVVRNISGEEHADQAFSPPSEAFCTAHTRKGNLQVAVQENHPLIPGTTLKIDISPDFGPAFWVATCNHQVNIISISLNSTERHVSPFSRSFPQAQVLTQGVVYDIRLALKLLDGHIMWLVAEREYSVPTAPERPQNFTVDESSRHQTSVHLLWSAVGYTQRPSNGYKVKCSATNSTFACDPAVDAEETVTYDTNVTVTELHPAVKYTCTVILQLQNGYGDAAEVTFWTKAKDIIPLWTRDILENQPIIEADRVTILLPWIDTDDISLYRYLQVQITSVNTAEKFIMAELDLQSNASRLFTIGDGFIYGGFHNQPLLPGSYQISVGYRAVIEGTVSSFHIIPGGSNVPLGPVNDELLGPPKIPFYIYPITGGSAGLVLIVFIIALVVRCRRRRLAADTSAHSTSINRGFDQTLGNADGPGGDDFGAKTLTSTFDESAYEELKEPRYSTKTPAAKTTKPDQRCTSLSNNRQQAGSSATTRADIIPPTETEPDHMYDALPITYENMTDRTYKK